jgi:hypothetical protein
MPRSALSPESLDGSTAGRCSHRDDTPVLAAFCGFIVMLGLVAALPPRPNGQ